MDELFKNSLMGQLQNLGLQTGVEEIPSLTLNFDEEDIKNSPFGDLHKKEATDPIAPVKNTPASKAVQKRLNDYDFNILQDSVFVDIGDKELSLEEKISKIQGLLDEINKKLFLIEGRAQSNLYEKLSLDKAGLEEVLEKLKSQQKPVIMNEELRKTINSTTFGALSKIKELLPEDGTFGGLLYKFFPKIYKGFLMKKALNKLNALNQTTKELISKQIPYGESDRRYDALIEYLSSANTIHAKLIKKI